MKRLGGRYTRPGRPGPRGHKGDMGDPGVIAVPQSDGSLQLEATEVPANEPAPVAVAVPPPPMSGAHVMQVIDGALSWVALPETE